MPKQNTDFQRALRLSAYLVAALVAVLVMQRSSLCASQEPSPAIQRWTHVELPQVGPDGTIYVVGTFADMFPSKTQDEAGGREWTAGPQSNYLYALNPNGTQKWSFALQRGERPFFLKAGPLGTAYVADDYYLHAVDSNGAEKWKAPFKPFWLEVGPQGIIYLYTLYPPGPPTVPPDKAFHALNSDGTEKWKMSAQAAPVLGPDGAIYVGTGNLLRALKPDGTRKWSLALGRGEIRTLNAPPPNSGSPWMIYVLSRSNLYAVTANGVKRWSFPFVGEDPSLAFGAHDTIYFCVGNVLYAFNRNGAVKWKFHPPKEITGIHLFLVGSDGTIYVGGEPQFPGSELYALKPDGTLKWQLISESSPRREQQSEERVCLGEGCDSVYQYCGVGSGVGGVVYLDEIIGNWGGYLVAIGPDGKDKWVFGEGYNDSALGTDGTIYLANNKKGYPHGPIGGGALYTLTPAGVQKWKFVPGDKDGNSPRK